MLLLAVFCDFDSLRTRGGCEPAFLFPPCCILCNFVYVEHCVGYFSLRRHTLGLECSLWHGGIYVVVDLPSHFLTWPMSLLVFPHSGFSSAISAPFVMESFCSRFSHHAVVKGFRGCFSCPLFCHGVPPGFAWETR